MYESASVLYKFGQVGKEIRPIQQPGRVAEIHFDLLFFQRPLEVPPLGRLSRATYQKMVGVFFIIAMFASVRLDFANLKQKAV